MNAVGVFTTAKSLKNNKVSELSGCRSLPTLYKNSDTPILFLYTLFIYLALSLFYKTPKLID
jgi:hypothetical protein